MTDSFLLYFYGRIIYDGRALGSLGPGNFLLLKKNDGSVSVHAGTNIPPRNYMGAGSELKKNKNELLFTRKNETIKIEIDILHFMNPLAKWSEDLVELRRTEKELADKIFHSWNDYIDAEVEIIEREYKTDVGDIDVVGWAADLTIHIVEVKRRRASIPDCTQLQRYVEEMGTDAHGYLASPEIGDKALEYLRKRGFKWIQVEFDEIPIG